MLASQFASGMTLSMVNHVTSIVFNRATMIKNAENETVTKCILPDEDVFHEITTIAPTTTPSITASPEKTTLVS